MSESAAFVAGGGFVRLRDSSNGFSAEINRQKKVEADRLAKQQAENLRREVVRAEEEIKRKASREADAAKAFREYHRDPSSRRTAIGDYAKVRFGYGYSTDDLRQALAELNSPEMLERFYPERFVQLTDAEFKKHHQTTMPCPSRERG